MISAIVAVDNNFGIGFNNELLEHIPEDLKFFKRMTNNNVVIMGRKTYDSLPKRPLPNRLNVVITSNKKEDSEIIKYMTLEEVKEFLAMTAIETEIFICGGATIYKELLPFCDKVYLTKIYKTHDNVDSYFPNIDKMPLDWKCYSQSELFDYNGIKYQFLQYFSNKN